MNDIMQSPNERTNTSQDMNSSNVFATRRMRRFIRRSMLFPFALIAIVVMVLGFFSLRSLTSESASAQSTAKPPTSDTRVAVQAPQSQQQLNRQFLFPLRDVKGNEVSKIKYEIQNVELRNEIVIKGERATAIKGRTFLIVNLKITNDYDKPIQLNARDYLRLITVGSSEKLAPDIHNDPVEIQAISTKYTRVGFPIDDTQRDLTLQVGEIKGKKETIKLQLQ